MSIFSSPEKRTVRFHLKSGETIEGVQDGKTSESHVVLAAKLLTSSEEIPLTGHLEIPKSNVLFIQVG